MRIDMFDVLTTIPKKMLPEPVVYFLFSDFSVWNINAFCRHTSI